ncbi:hypothetical protein GN958_ATG05111 [Phytophthora infestans]|uniref:Uncharacterized protein n=1 Tax=Phytophthora infestans TaxID=4787 RepID=A0A8S9V2I6_PHYIN|nr:hypothetical protein GN958_ATG05111 [Phytophthora infestans]
MTGKCVFNIPTPKAIRSWPIAISHFDGMDAALTWVKLFTILLGNPMNRMEPLSIYKNFVLSAITTGSLFVAEKPLLRLHRSLATVFTNPEDILRSPIFDSDWIKAQTTWEQLAAAWS